MWKHIVKSEFALREDGDSEYVNELRQAMALLSLNSLYAKTGIRSRPSAVSPARCTPSSLNSLYAKTGIRSQATICTIKTRTSCLNSLYAKTGIRRRLIAEAGR